MTVQTSTGVTIALIDSLPITNDDDGFNALAFVEVAEVTEIPEYGSVSTVVEHANLATGIIEKHKGSSNNGSVSVQMGRDSSDAGQVLLKAGNDGASKNVEHSFRITFPDLTLNYFTGKIYSYTTNAGSNNNIVGSTVVIEINGTNTASEVVDAIAELFETTEIFETTEVFS